MAILCRRARDCACRLAGSSTVVNRSTRCWRLAAATVFISSLPLLVTAPPDVVCTSLTSTSTTCTLSMCSSIFVGEQLQQQPGTVYADGNSGARWEERVRRGGRNQDGWGMDKSEDASVGTDIPVVPQRTWMCGAHTIYWKGYARFATPFFTYWIKFLFLVGGLF